MYNFIVRVVRGIYRLFNGKITSVNRDKLPDDDTFVLIAPHHYWLDPVIYIVDGFPKRYTSIAKEELREYKILNWLIDKLEITTVNRDRPGPSVIKEPVKMLKEKNRNVLIFPSGSRTNTDLKEGAVTIARLSKKQMIPAVFVGPTTLKEVFTRKRTYVLYGDPIEVPRDRNETINVMAKIEKTFSEMEAELTHIVDNQDK